MRLIDADDFENSMYHEVFEKDTVMQKWDSGCWMRYKLFENVLREQPTIEPERKEGKWITDGEFPKCSECGKWIDVFQGDAEMNYCPHCGAELKGE